MPAGAGYGRLVDAIDIARAALERAQQRSGATVRTVHSLAELDEARDVFDTTWPIVGGGSNLPSNLFRALAHAGAYACAVDVDGRAVGATVAFIARGPDLDARPEGGGGSEGGAGPEGGARPERGARPEGGGASGRNAGSEPERRQLIMLHSHMAAVLDGYRNRSLGTAMKCHQRLWALEHDIPVITWTFDPLVRRNLRVNMLKLGAQVRSYERNFYGRMDDDYDFIDESDRVFAWWVVDSDRANEAALGRLRALTDEELAARPEARVISIPPDIVALREVNIDEARRWRLRVREQMESALAAGYRVTNLTEAGDYVMERADA